MGQLLSALDKALPGDQIRLASGVYSGEARIYNSGTASAPITICALKGVWPKITGGAFHVKGDHLQISGILFEGPNLDNNVFMYNVHHVLFTFNEIRNGDANAGISMDLTRDVEISYNYIHHNGLTRIDHGIYIRKQSGPGTVIANNIIEANEGRGISIHSNAGDAINDLTVVHNTIIKNGSTGILLAVNAGMRNVVSNNILSENGATYNYKQIRVMSGSEGSIRNNITWSSIAKYQGIEISPEAASVNTILGNLSLDPQFVNLSGGDYNLLASSPAKDLAFLTYGMALDYDGKIRDNSPDSGALELVSTQSEPLPPVTQPELLAPENPSDLVATAVAVDAIKLDWLDNSLSETGFKVQRSDGGCSGEFNLIATLPADTQSYTDRGLASGSTYCYRIKAFSEAGASFSGQASATTLVETVKGKGGGKPRRK